MANAVTRERNSNHELMRILSMFFIVLGHVFLFGRLLDTPNKSMSIIYYFFEFILIVHVNSYVLVSGYYQSKSKFKQKQLLKIINASWFYRIVILLLFSILGIISVSKVQVLKDLLPVTIDNYWFIKVYILLYCLSPFINKLISSISKNFYQKMLLCGFLVFSIIPAITGGEMFFNNGYSLYGFIYLYLVGAYLRIYPLENSYFFRIFSKKLFRVIMICLFLGCALLNNILFYYGKHISGTNQILDLVASYIDSASLAYSNPIIIIQSVAYFSIFTTLDIKSKFINKCSSLMLGVYFIHENNYVRSKIYGWLGLLSVNSSKSWFIFYAFLMTVVIFVGSMIIERLRVALFKFISNRKISEKIRNRYYKWLSELYIIRSSQG